VGFGAVGGELEPDLRAVLVSDTPASGERVDELQSETAWREIGRPPADRPRAEVLDVDAHDAVGRGGPDL
jgi:hypothetical protein